MAKFYLVSAFLSIVTTSATASFGVKFTVTRNLYLIEPLVS
ncbi:hypothetical protein CAMGR0001_0929 [Campylobacter gracilis RM3268]|uniref:Uncharacterized protein n=1 Tax=Campylobacter gracilis RM3268 TaxID=553220 RepID=C8PGD6_9BACT|nr:hypothetical protein CAMGR0001_0929 [Campylobacter gracilis RM3268]